jgi:hypothetical protein
MKGRKIVNPFNSDEIKRVLRKGLDRHSPTSTFEGVWAKYSTGKKSFFGKKLTLVTTSIMIIFLISAGFSYYKFYWSNIEITINEENKDYLDEITPIEIFENIGDSPNARIMSLAEIRQVANFPIRIPKKIDGWKRIKSIGLATKIYFSENHEMEFHEKENFTEVSVTQTINTEETDTRSVLDEELSYWDLYMNQKGQKIVVKQQFDEIRTESLQSSTGSYSGSTFPYGSVILNQFGKDLAVLMDIKKGRKQLNIFHIEDNNHVTLIKIWSDAEESVVKQVAHLYLQN